MIFLKSLKRPIAVLLITLSFCLLGVMLVTNLPVKLYPSTQKTRISVSIPHPSFTAVDFESEYGEILNDAVNTLENVDEVESEFNNGSTSIRFYFNWGFPGSEAKALVASAFANIKNQLPEESENLRVWYWAGRTAGFFSVAASSKVEPSKKVFETLEPLMKGPLSRIKNTDIAAISNVEEVRVDIILKPERILELGLTPDVIADSIRRSYRDVSLGSFRAGRDAFSVRVNKGIVELEDIRKVVVTTVNDNSVTLADVAEVNVYNGLPHRLYSVNGNQAITIFAMPDENGNIRDLAQQIKDLIASIKDKIPDHIEFLTLVDPGQYINNAILNVVKAGAIGGFLAIMITLIFLGDVRNTVMIAVSIPTSVMLSFVLMHLFDVTINLISLGGLTLSVGMVVDSSIVVIENIHRHVRSMANPREGLIPVIVKSMTEVRAAIIASILTSVVVFLPIQFTSELTSAILGDLASMVIFILAASLCVAMFVLPTIAKAVFEKFPNDRSKWLKTNVTMKVNRLSGGYQKILETLLHSRKRALIAVITPFVILVVVLVVLGPQITREIIAKPDSAVVSVRFLNSETKEPEELLEAIKPLEKKLMDKWGDVTVNLFARIHRANVGVFSLTLKSTEIRSRVIEELQEEFKSGGPWRFTVRRWDPAELPLPRTDDLRVSFIGPDQNVIVDLMDRAMNLIQDADLYADVQTEPSTEKSQYIILEPREQIISHTKGIDLQKLAASARVALAGRRVIQMTHKDEPMDIELEYPKNHFQNDDDVQNFLISTPYGGVPFKHFFEFSRKEGISEIIKDGEDKVFQVVAKLKESTPPWQRDLLENKSKALLEEKLVMPAGYSFRFEDTQEAINTATVGLLIALAISIFLIYVILGIQFNSLFEPLVILMAIPLGLIGVVTSLFVFDSTLSLNSMLGTILLGGIAVNNSILIFDFFKQFRGEFETKKEALIHACSLRITPIMITTLTTILGMMPLALAMGEGTNVIQPLGIAVSGGLGVSSLMTVFVIPCMLYLLPERQQEVRRA